MSLFCIFLLFSLCSVSIEAQLPQELGSLGDSHAIESVPCACGFSMDCGDGAAEQVPASTYVSIDIPWDASLLGPSKGDSNPGTTESHQQQQQKESDEL